jgi:glycolate oxidase iron-sulfur subunit
MVAAATMQMERPAGSVAPTFDDADRPDREGILDCVHCGLCLPTCPTYLTTGIEMASPRGRIYLVRAVDEGQAGISAEFVKHLDQCLGCLACQTACPSGVPYGHLLEAARTQIERKYDRPPSDRRWRRMLLALFPYPERLGWVVSSLYWYQRLGLQSLVRISGALNLVSRRLVQMEALLPDIPSPADRQALPEVTLATRARVGRIGFLIGCAQRFFLPEVNRATARVLAATGYEVVAPRGQGCCGALHLHSGYLEEGRELARRTIETFERAGVDAVAVNAAGCGAAMKDYGHLLRDDPAWQARAEAFSGKVRDVSQILAETRWNGSLKPVPLTVTYHEACHLAHAQRIRKEPRAILQRIPGLRLVELLESDLCCGNAGVYNLLQVEMASQLLQRKVDRIRETGAGIVAMGNIGCLLQIGRGLRQAGLPVRAVHPVELVDWALHGMPTQVPRA